MQEHAGNIQGIYAGIYWNIWGIPISILWYKVIRNKEHRGTAFGGAPKGAAAKCDLCFWLFDIINIYGYSLYIPYMSPKYFPYISLMCFSIYGVKSRSGHDQMTTFGSISHV